MQQRATTRLRDLIRSKTFLHMPAVYDALTGRLVQSLGFEATYVGGYVTGGSSTVTEPLLTMTEQVRLAEDIARKNQDARSWSMRVRGSASRCTPCGRCGNSSAPASPAFTSRTRSIPSARTITNTSCTAFRSEEFVEKIQYAVKQRDELDPDFVIIARSDTCRALGLDEAVVAVNRAADVGADLGLLFPRNQKDAEEAPRQMPRAAGLCAEPRQSRRPADLQPQGTAGDGLRRLHRGAGGALQRASTIRRRCWPSCARPAQVTDMTSSEWVASRQEIEDLIDLTEHYEIEEQTAEGRQQRA